jgi:hypothetical protein
MGSKRNKYLLRAKRIKIDQKHKAQINEALVTEKAR